MQNYLVKYKANFNGEFTVSGLAILNYVVLKINRELNIIIFKT